MQPAPPTGTQGERSLQHGIKVPPPLVARPGASGESELSRETSDHHSTIQTSVQSEKDSDWKNTGWNGWLTILIRSRDLDQISRSRFDLSIRYLDLSIWIWSFDPDLVSRSRFDLSISIEITSMESVIYKLGVGHAKLPEKAQLV